jgi:hypothetical protein
MAADARGSSYDTISGVQVENIMDARLRHDTGGYGEQARPLTEWRAHTREGLHAGAMAACRWQPGVPGAAARLPRPLRVLRLLLSCSQRIGCAKRSNGNLSYGNRAAVEGANRLVQTCAAQRAL